jgi:hypothetical protein
MSKLWKKFGLIGKVKKKPKSELVMPDEEALQRAARRRGALRAQSSGRMSTILDDETLG